MPVDVRTLEPLLGELNEKIDQLRVAYEQYYLGLELMPPEDRRQAIARAFAQLSGTHIANTALKFKYQSLCQKWGSYSQYWHRVQREIDAGTYFRHVQRVRRKERLEGSEDSADLDRLVDAIGVASGAGSSDPAGAPPGAASDALFGPSGTGVKPGPALPAEPFLPGDHDDLDSLLESSFIALTTRLADSSGSSVSVAKSPPLPSASPTSSPRGTPPPFPPRPPYSASTAAGSTPALPPSLDPSALDDVYARLVETKRRLGQPVPPGQREQLTTLLARQIPVLLAKNPGARVELDVVVKEDGKIVLKAIPKR